MRTTKVGIRQFRENLSTYLESAGPVAITRHGVTIGIYVPTKPKSNSIDLDALRVAGAKVQALLQTAGVTEEDVLADFRKQRQAKRKR